MEVKMECPTCRGALPRCDETASDANATCVGSLDDAHTKSLQ